MTISETERAALAGQLRSGRRRGRVPEGRGVEASQALEASYYKDLKKIIDDVSKEIEKIILPILAEGEDSFVKKETVEVQDRGPRGVDLPNFKTKEAARIAEEIRREIEKLRLFFERDIDLYAYFISSRTFEKGSKASRLAFIKDLKETIGVDVSKVLKDEGIESSIRTAVRNNVELIKTIPNEYFDDIENSILQGIDEGKDFFSINADLLELNGQNKRRARVIARDQVGKITGEFNRLRQKELGISHYRWRTAGDESVRSEHKKLNGRRFAWDETPPGGDRPGQAIQCRCVAEPIIAGILGEL
jgi:SPP1 gp7 family putative phage head morphogenesis protein